MPPSGAALPRRRPAPPAGRPAAARGPPAVVGPQAARLLAGLPVSGSVRAVHVGVPSRRRAPRVPGRGQTTVPQRGHPPPPPPFAAVFSPVCPSRRTLLRPPVWRIGNSTGLCAPPRRPRPPPHAPPPAPLPPGRWRATP